MSASHTLARPQQCRWLQVPRHSRRPPPQLPPPLRHSDRTGSTAAAASPHSFVIRPIQPTDVPRLAEIEQQCAEFSACWSAADIAAELDNPLSHAAVAVALPGSGGSSSGSGSRDTGSSGPLGYIVAWLVAGELQVLECAVDPAHQSRGIGSALLQHMLQSHSHPQGAVLEVKAHNARAIALYRRHGFQEVGRRPRFYACGADALLMAARPASPLSSRS